MLDQAWCGTWSLEDVFYCLVTVWHMKALEKLMIGESASAVLDVFG